MITPQLVRMTDIYIALVVLAVLIVTVALAINYTNVPVASEPVICYTPSTLQKYLEPNNIYHCK